VAVKLLTLDRTLEPLLTPLLALLDVPVDDDAWGALDPPQRRQRILEAVKRLLLRESQVQPLLLLFEDLHWMDSESQALLDSLIESLPTARVLLLVSYRPEYQHPWGSKTYYTQLRIDPLPSQTAEELLTALLGQDGTLEPLKRALIERTEGNPFFLEESVQTLVETKVLVGDRGAYRMTRAPEAWQIPATAQAIVTARIDRLPPEDKRLLQAASVIGKDVPLTLLRVIADVPARVVHDRCACRLRRAANNAPSPAVTSVTVAGPGTGVGAFGSAVPVISTRRPVGLKVACTAFVTTKSRVLMPSRKPLVIMNGVNSPNPVVLICPVGMLLMRMLGPPSSTAHPPEIDAVSGSRPVRSNVVR